MATRRQRRLVTFTVIAGSGVLVATQVRHKWGEVRPVRRALELLGDRAPGGSGGVAKSLHKFVYEQLSGRMDDAGSSFLNYGFAPLEPPYQDVELPPELEPDRYGMQLYNRVAGGADLVGKDVLEVGCGRGGGASFVFDRFKPSSMVGLDLAEKAVAHCNNVHGRAGLEFRAGDAEDLPFADGSFDAVLNVESSHCYPNFDRFLGEVSRVLRPGGHLLFADLRGEDPTGETPSPRDELREQIRQAGFEIVEEEDITRNVVRSLDLDSDRREASVKKYTPKVLQPQMLDFAGIIGSKTYDNFDSGRATYTRFVARKPAPVGASV